MYTTSLIVTASGLIAAVNSTFSLPSTDTVPVTLLFNGIGLFDGSWAENVLAMWSALIGHGGKANDTVFLMIGTVMLQFPPQAGQVNFKGIRPSTLASTVNVVPWVMSLSKVAFTVAVTFSPHVKVQSFEPYWSEDVQPDAKVRVPSAPVTESTVRENWMLP